MKINTTAIDFSVKIAAHKLGQGKLIIYPTESVYGIGCDAKNFVSVQRVIALKKRAQHKGLILIVSHIKQLLPFISPTLSIGNVQKALLSVTQRPTTWLLPASPFCPALLRGKHNTIAIRLTQHPIAKQLCHYFKHAIVSTSANISNKPAIIHKQDIRKTFKENTPFIVKGPLGHQPKPSQIIDYQTQEVIRS